MSLWTAAEAALATGGRAFGDWAVSGVSIDTRTLAPGDLFVALKAARDGHDFVAGALAAGAGAAMVSRPPENVAPDAPLLLVADVLEGLTRLGAAGRARSPARIVAVTGSAGKTSTKEMLRAILSGQGRTHAAEASYNNHWGVPLTLARMPRDAEFAVLEIGMNAPGEIAPLARLARPHVAVVTTIAPAHLAAFDDIEGIAREKASIFEGVEPGGTAVINADVAEAALLRAAAAAQGLARVEFGRSADGFRLLACDTAGATTICRLAQGGETLAFRLAAPGAHFAMNGAAALAAAAALGADLAIAAGDLGRWAPPPGRGTRETVELDPVEDAPMELIDDAFNSNPASLAAALDVLAGARPVDGVGRISRGRRIAILGDMLELGAAGPDLHAGIAAHPAMAAVDEVHCVGPLMAGLWRALPEAKRGRRVETAEDLLPELRHLVDAGDVVLVKGSKSIRVSLLAEAIRNLGRPRPASR